MIARFERGFIYASIKNDLGFFQKQILGMKWLNDLIGGVLSALAGHL